MTLARWLVTALVWLGFTACRGGPDVCSTDSASNVDEGPTMRPGGDCIECHRGGEGPRYAIAGTVMQGSNDDEDCNGVQGVTVVVTGSDGKGLSLTTNSAGNFFTTQTVAFPFTAKVVRGTRVRVMSTPQSNGDCASCHTATGANGAPGRILPP